ncbi:MAG TPA: ATP-dependent helicase [Streptosporangiaceae bacterium]|jgi:DNA helicase-2/ATP-dependent DNA helicase PcrA
MTTPAGALAGLNDEQRAAATHAGGPLLILAGAGSGKTRTLVARAAWLREGGVPAARILLLTFTRRAADDMLARARPPDAPPAERITGGTFHAIAHRIIRAHAESFALPPEFSVIDPADVTDIMDTLRADHDLVGTRRRAPRAATCADIYTRCVNTSTPLTKVVAASFPWCRPYVTQLGGLFRAYGAHKRAHGLADFDDLLLLWRAALADPAAGPVLRGLFDAVLVDEYQDVNAVQADIVRLLRPGGDGLTCVGDDAQAIYGFRGADPAHLRALSGSYPDLTIVRLARNYRSRHMILQLANAVRPQSAGLELELTAGRHRGPGAQQGQLPVLMRCHDEAGQAREICARILECHEAGVPFMEQAVLVRTASHSDLLEIELTARGIPFIKYGGLRFTEAAHVKDFIAAARIVANPADDLAWFRLLRLHEGIGPVLARRVIDALALTEPAPLGRWAAAAQCLPPRARPALAATVEALTAAAALPQTAARAAAVLAAVHDPVSARYPDAAARLADLQRLADAAAARPSLHDALVELALDPPQSGSDLAGRPRLDDDFLIISTIHSAKGLEWPVVHLPQLVDGAVPSDMALSDPDGEAEEQRLFYVAVTRARDQLYLYAPLRLHQFRMARDDRHGYALLTRFLGPVQLAHCEVTDAAPPEPLIPRLAPLAETIGHELESLWDADSPAGI